MTQQAIQLVITATPAGTTVSGPIDNTALCYGLLELARDLVYEHAKKLREARVSLVTQIPPNGRGHAAQ